eukprot:scaffold36182_cov30-Prasinocladus_malaysianus.AAC.2
MKATRGQSHRIKHLGIDLRQGLMGLLHEQCGQIAIEEITESERMAPNLGLQGVEVLALVQFPSDLIPHRVVKVVLQGVHAVECRRVERDAMVLERGGDPLKTSLELRGCHRC